MVQAAEGIPRAVWAVTALHLVLLLSYSVLVPAFRAPDEHLHVDRARQLVPGAPEPDVGEGSVSAAVLAARESLSVYRTASPPASSVDAVPPAERPTFADVGPEGPSEAVNGIARQPPLVHAVGAAAGRAPTHPRGLGLQQRRSAGGARGRPVPAGGSGDDGRRFAAHHGPRRRGSRRRLLTSGLGLVFVPWVVGVYLLAPAVPGIPGKASALPRLAVVGVVATVAGGWWWVRELIVEGHLLFDLDASQVTPIGDGQALVPTRAFATLVGSFWGGFGWLEASLPTVAALPLVALVGALSMQAMAIAAIAGRYWAGPSAGERFREVLAFSPWLPVLVFFAGVGVLALVVWTLVEVGRVVHGPLPPPPPRRRRPAA